MQEPHIQLKEIIWEITDVCYNNCSYCGSKDILNKVCPGYDSILTIAEQIAKYPPEEINISGGDPLAVPVKTHEEITKILKPKCAVKIIVNPNSFITCEWVEKKLEMYDWVGVSINSFDELGLLKLNWDKVNREKLTIITNFNIENIFEYSMIEEFVKSEKLTWQIQYTMYKDADRRAIYNNEDAKELLFKRISNSIKYGVKIVLADNLTAGSCAAGKNSLGILADGEVIPCLSMRSWLNKIEDYCGNILTTNLKKIWEENFGKFRCSKFECCKDKCNAPYAPPPIQSLTITPSEVQGWPQPILDGPITWPKDWNNPAVIAYGVTTNQTFVYGVATNETTSNRLYGVAAFKTGGKGKTPFDVPTREGWSDYKL